MSGNSLSEYGWIIVTTLLMVVLIAFSAPYAHYATDKTGEISNQWVEKAFDEEFLEEHGYGTSSSSPETSLME